MGGGGKGPATKKRQTFFCDLVNLDKQKSTSALCLGATARPAKTGLQTSLNVYFLKTFNIRIIDYGSGKIYLEGLRSTYVNLLF